MSFLNWGGNRVHKNKKEDTVYICKDFFFFKPIAPKSII